MNQDSDREISKEEMLAIWTRVENGDMSVLLDMAYWHHKYPALDAEYDKYVESLLQFTNKFQKAPRPSRLEIMALQQPLEISKKASKDELLASVRRKIEAGRQRMKSPDITSIGDALAGSGLQITKLYRTWTRAMDGNINCLRSLDKLISHHPKLHIVFSAFERGWSGPQGPNTSRGKKKIISKYGSTWSKMITTKLSSIPVSGGLPTLGKKR